MTTEAAIKILEYHQEWRLGRKDDALVVPIEETMERVKKAMPNSTQVILGDADHGYNGYEQQLADTIKDWILK